MLPQLPTVISSYMTGRVGHLAQGAPTSPMLSNLAMVRFDTDVARLAERSGLIYTRYADDLIFSNATTDFCRSRAEQMVQAIYTVMLNYGLRPHSSKTVIAPPGARKVVLGLLVDRDRPRLSRRFRGKLEQHLFYLVRNGPVSHARRRGFRSVFSMQQYIKGLLSFANQVDPTYAAPLRTTFATVKWGFEAD